MFSLDPAGIVLAPHGKLMHLIDRNRADGMEDIHLFIADFIVVKGDHRFHGDQAEDLEKMILDHVAQGPGLIIIMAPVFHADLFGHGDLDMIDVASVPDRLKQGIGKAEGQDILDGLLTQIVVDTKNLGFVKDPASEHSIQSSGPRPGPGRMVFR